MRNVRLSARSKLAVIVCLALSGWTLNGCQLLGPNAIQEGRDRYNRIIHSTSKEQMLANLVRVYEHEPTLFMDVTEVDAGQSFGGSLAGAATNIGAAPGHPTSTAGTIAGEVGNAGGTVQYTETPITRYQPLLGQALISQLVTPLDVGKLPQLLNSQWPVSSVLDLAVYNLVLDRDEFFSVLNSLIELEKDGAVEYAAVKSKLTKEQQKPAQPGTYVVQMSNSAPPAANSLVVYLIPPHPHEQGAEAEPSKRLEYLI
jgi:hypothetical protein